MIEKTIVLYEGLYLVKIIKDSALPYLIFVNGGPGMSCAVIESLIADHYLFDHLDYNIICYDQRNTGRSKGGGKCNVSHQDNIDDLKLVIDLFITDNLVQLHGIIAHSYGAKLVADTYKQHQLSMPVVFLSTSDSILTPRINNLILDLAYLKKTDENRYHEVYSKLNDISIDSIWKVTEELAALFQDNKERPLHYWANLEKMKLIQDIQSQLDHGLNQDVFMSVRKDLYSDPNNYMVDINSLCLRYLWINGFHDYIMNSAYSGCSKKIIFM